MDQIASLMYHVSIVTPQAAAAAAPPTSEDGTPRPAPVVDEGAQRRAEQLLARERSKLEDHLMNARASHGDESVPAEAKSAKKNEDGKKVGRNDPCPCGSGKKYKNCHGKDK